MKRFVRKTSAIFALSLFFGLNLNGLIIKTTIVGNTLLFGDIHGAGTPEAQKKQLETIKEVFSRLDPKKHYTIIVETASKEVCQKFEILNHITKTLLKKSENETCPVIKNKLQIEVAQSDGKDPKKMILTNLTNIISNKKNISLITPDNRHKFLQPLSILTLIAIANKMYHEESMLNTTMKKLKQLLPKDLTWRSYLAQLEAQIEQDCFFASQDPFITKLQTQILCKTKTIKNKLYEKYKKILDIPWKNIPRKITIETGLQYQRGRCHLSLDQLFFQCLNEFQINFLRSSIEPTTHPLLSYGALWLDLAILKASLNQKSKIIFAGNSHTLNLTEILLKQRRKKTSPRNYIAELLGISPSTLSNISPNDPDSLRYLMKYVLRPVPVSDLYRILDHGDTTLLSDQQPKTILRPTRDELRRVWKKSQKKASVIAGQLLLTEVRSL